MRFQALQFIGGYKGYLDSDHWRSTRAAAIERARGTGPPSFRLLTLSVRVFLESCSDLRSESNARSPVDDRACGRSGS